MTDRERRDWLLVALLLQPADAQVAPSWCEEQLWRCQQFNANLEGTCEGIVATATDYAAWRTRQAGSYRATITAQAADIRDLAGACPERVRWAGALPVTGR